MRSIKSFLLQLKLPMPKAIRDASEFSRDFPTEAITSFWGQQLIRLEQMVADASLTQKKWGDSIPSDIAPDAGKIKTVALSQLMKQFGVGWQRWIRQFPMGFPIAGSLSQHFAFDRGKKIKPLEPRHLLFDSAASRFRERATKSGHANAQQLWGEATTQVGEGWLPPPVPINDAGRPEGWRPRPYNIAFRFGVPQDSRLRAFGDMKHS